MLKSEISFLKIIIRFIYIFFRKRFVFYFKKSHVKKSLAERKGECKACGTCCKKNVICPFLTQEGKCKIYSSQPFFCHSFPIDENELKLNKVEGICGYYWEKKESN